MKKTFLLMQLFLFLGIGFSLVFGGTGQGSSQTDSVSSNQKSVPAKYKIARYIIGAYGVKGAVSSNHIHWATAGQMFAGDTRNASNWLISGFVKPTTSNAAENSHEEITGLPTDYELYQNCPNPFNPQTVIRYKLPQACLVTVEVFNVIGQRIRLLSSQIQGPGQAEVIWNGRDDQGKMMGSGIYWYRVTAFGTETRNNDTNILFRQTKKMLLVK